MNWQNHGNQQNQIHQWLRMMHGRMVQVHTEIRMMIQNGTSPKELGPYHQGLINLIIQAKQVHPPFEFMFPMVKFGTIGGCLN